MKDIDAIKKWVGDKQDFVHGNLSARNSCLYSYEMPIATYEWTTKTFVIVPYSLSPSATTTRHIHKVKMAVGV